jgi:glycosyltransferase involved in cell wall biosynthesis
MIRVAYVLDNLNTGGTELNAVRTAERLDRSRFDVRFMAMQPHGPLRGRLDAAGIQVHDINIPGLLTPGAFRRGAEVRDLIRRERVVIVHAHDPYANVFMVPWAHRGGASLIASHRWWRSVHRRRVRLANRIAYRFADRVLANSESVGELVVREERVPRERMIVVPNFVDDAAFTPMDIERRRALRSQFGIAEDHVAVGVVANLYAVKNHALLVRVASRLAAAWPNVRYVLVGEGAERTSLTALARALGVQERIILPGRVSHEPGLGGAFDIAVLTSHEEGFPNWVVEAMAAGRPVVATAVGGVPDAVVDGETGYLVNPDDESAFADSLERLLRDEPLAQRLGVQGRERARRLYHETRVMSTLQALYEELVKENAR